MWCPACPVFTRKQLVPGHIPKQVIGNNNSKKQSNDEMRHCTLQELYFFPGNSGNTLEVGGTFFPGHFNAKALKLVENGFKLSVHLEFR